jgi:hypothetical protein
MQTLVQSYVHFGVVPFFLVFIATSLHSLNAQRPGFPINSAGALKSLSPSVRGVYDQCKCERA